MPDSEVLTNKKKTLFTSLGLFSAFSMQFCGFTVMSCMNIEIKKKEIQYILYGEH